MITPQDLTRNPKSAGEIALRAWQNAFGTNQLSHALAQRDQLTADNTRLRGEVEASRKLLNYVRAQMGEFPCMCEGKTKCLSCVIAEDINLHFKNHELRP